MADLTGTSSEFDELIEENGNDVEIVPRLACPCIDSPKVGGQGRPNPVCSACEGSGITYSWAMRKKTLAVIASLDTSKTSTPARPLQAGNIRLTFQSNVKLVEGDLIRVLQFSAVTDFLRPYQKVVGGMVLPFDVVAVEFIGLRNGDDGVDYLKRGKDYTLNIERNLLSFPEGSRVSQGRTISGRFLCRPYYLISSLPAQEMGFPDGFGGFESFPVQAVAQRADSLFGRFQREISQWGDAINGS